MKNNMKKNFFWNTLGVGIFSLTSLLYTIILMRFSNLQMTGIFSIGFTLACTTTALASLGGRTYQVTDIKNNISTFTYILTKFINVFLVILIILVYLFIQDYKLTKFFIIFVLCLYKYVEEISDVYYGIMQKHDKLYYVGQFQILKSIINVLAFFLIMKIKGNLFLAVSAILSVNILFALVIERNTARKLEKWEYITNKTQIMKYFKINIVICIFTFLTMYLSNAPKYAIDVLLNDEIQAIFSILIMPATVMLLVCNFVVNPILITVAELYNNNKTSKIISIFKKIFIIVLIIGIFGLIVCNFIGIPILNFIYKNNFNSYKLELLLIIAGSIFYSLSSIISSLLTAIRKINIQLFMNIFFAIFAFIVSIVFVKKYEILGGSIAYLIIMIIRMITYLIFWIRYCKIKEQKE